MNENGVVINESVNCSEIIKFLQANKENKTDIHSFEIIQDGEVKVRIALPPYSFEYKQQLYSLSKSFSSTALGFLVDDGIVDINSRVVDVFKDKCPENIGENLSKMRIYHLLSMNTGHSSCLLNDIRTEKDPVKAFLKFEPEFEPGTHFVYNNAATFMIAETVRKYTGMTLYDFLSQRLFKPLQISGTYWNAFVNGNSQGAVGLHASTDDIAKLGILYLNKGVYNGERLLSEKWVETATKTWSDTSGNGTADWSSGYGFQFWQNAREGYRGDGAFGQLCMVLPSKNMVFAMEETTEDMQKVMDLIGELLDNLYTNGNAAVEELRCYVNNYNTPCKYCSGEIPNKLYRCKENGFGITFAEFSENEDSVILKFSDGIKWQEMRFGKGKFCENNVLIKKFKPTLEVLAGHNEKENVHFAAHCTFKENGLHLYFNYLDNPHTDEYICRFVNGTFEMKRATEKDFCYNETICGE